MEIEVWKYILLIIGTYLLYKYERSHHKFTCDMLEREKGYDTSRTDHMIGLEIGSLISFGLVCFFAWFIIQNFFVTQ